MNLYVLKKAINLCPLIFQTIFCVDVSAEHLNKRIFR